MLQLFRWGVQLFLVFFGVPIVFFSRYDIQGLERWCISNALFPSVFPTCNARRRRPCPCRRNSSPRRRWDLDIISGRAAGTNPSARRKCLVVSSQTPKLSAWKRIDFVRITQSPHHHHEPYSQRQPLAWKQRIRYALRHISDRLLHSHSILSRDSIDKIELNLIGLKCGVATIALPNFDDSN
jgi:hypothetical protein